MPNNSPTKINKFPPFLRGLVSLTSLFLLIEFFDEFHYGIGSAVLPAQRDDLLIQYAQVGLLLGLPRLVNTFIEPVLMLLGDTHLRKNLIVGGGYILALSLLMIALSPTFGWLLVFVILVFPASGAFVTLAQATLMDLNPGRESQMMARWVLSGSIANLAGPLFTAGLFALAFSWRIAFVFLAVLVLGLTFWTGRTTFPILKLEKSQASSNLGAGVIAEIRKLILGFLGGVKNSRLMRWIILLQLSDLMLDIYTSYTALYFRDVVGTNETQTSLLLGLFMVAGLLSDLIVVILVDRYPGRKIVRFSAAVVALLYPIWLLVSGSGLKIILAFLIKLFTLGWYSVLKGEAYAALPERKGTVLALDSGAGIFGGLLPWLVGWLAGKFSLPAAMWLLWLGPLSLLVFMPRAKDLSVLPAADSR